MRFFSNDARESADGQDDDARTEQIRSTRPDDEQPAGGQPDRVQSEPVAVPSQRPPSPWSNTPATATEGRDDTDPPPFHEPSPQPTAFGASTVGGAVAAAATANPVNDRWDATDRQSAADSGVGVGDDATIASGDGVVTSSTSTYAGSTAGTGPDAPHRDPDDFVDLPLDDDQRPAGAVSARSADAPVPPATDSPADGSVTAGSPAIKDEGGFDDPKAVDPATDRPLPDTTDTDTDAPVDSHPAVDSKLDDDRTDTDTDTGSAAVVGGAAIKDEGGFDDPKAVDPVTDTPLESTDSTPTPVVAVPVAATTTTPGTSGSPDKLFDAEDARELQERWRDVQLRFVDSPKDAAGDAAKLVDEAVEKLTASLRSQRDGLGGDTEDTEQLRLQLRGCRDILNRIVSL